MKRSEIKRRTPLKASRGLQRKTPLKSSAPLERATMPLRQAPIAKKRPRPKLTAAQKRPLAERSGGYCEIRKTGWCHGAATDVAHRIAEGMGGRHGAAAEANDRLSAVLHACRSCHEWCHRNVAAAEEQGWMLRNGDNPLLKRVYYAGRGWCHLDDDGGVTRL